MTEKTDFFNIIPNQTHYLKNNCIAYEKFLDKTDIGVIKY